MVHKQKVKYRLADNALGLLYPPACALCGSVLKRGEKYICGKCRPKVDYADSPVCLKCGKEIIDEDEELCADCLEYPKSYIRGFPAINYDETFSRSIAEFKYKNRRENVKYYAYEIIKCHGRKILDIDPEVLVPVPIHRKKRRRRGYNQAELLARELGAKLDIPVDDSLLFRVSNTAPQKELSPEDRERNLRSAFVATGGDINYNRVMLVDDIYTTGATVEACTSALNKKGIMNVYYTSVCIGKGY